MKRTARVLIGLVFAFAVLGPPAAADPVVYVPGMPDCE
jgi:hypothetical protein